MITNDIYYSLEKDVYIVKGAVNSCIYDLKQSKLFNINNKTYSLIKDTLNGKDFKENIEKEMINKLVENNILEASNNDSINKIKDIKELKETPIIDFVWIEVTKKCNLKCIHCYEECSKDKEDKINFEQLKLIVEQLKSLGTVKSIQFIGGEPLILQGELKKMIEYCVDKFDSIEVFSNLTMLDENWVRFFKKHNIHIATSVYSYDENEQDKVTNVKGSTIKLRKALSFLKKHNIKYRAEYTKMKGIEIGDENEETSKLFKLNLKSGNRSLRLTGRANLNMFDIDMLKAKIITKTTFSGPLDTKWIKQNLSGNKCFSKRLYIDSNLDVYPCVMERRLSHGNLKENSLKNMLKTDILDLSKDKIEACKDCEYRYTCFDCRPDSLNGDVYEKPWYCTYDPYKVEWQDENTFLEKIKKLQSEHISI